MQSADAYAARLDAQAAQAARIAGARAPADRWGGATAARFRLDPRRPLDPVLEAVASQLDAGDVLLDVGGGAGRISLPLASRCRAVVNVEPSPGMAAAFREA